MKHTKAYTAFVVTLLAMVATVHVVAWTAVWTKFGPGWTILTTAGVYGTIWAVRYATERDTP